MYLVTFIGNVCCLWSFSFVSGQVQWFISMRLSSSHLINCSSVLPSHCNDPWTTWELTYLRRKTGSCCSDPRINTSLRLYPRNLVFTQYYWSLLLLLSAPPCVSAWNNETMYLHDTQSNFTMWDSSTNPALHLYATHKLVLSPPRYWCRSLAAVRQPPAPTYTHDDLHTCVLPVSGPVEEVSFLKVEKAACLRMDRQGCRTGFVWGQRWGAPIPWM